MKKKRIKISLLVFISLVFIDNAICQLDHRMDIRLFGGYWIGKKIEVPAEMTTNTFDSKMPSFGFEVGVFPIKQLNVYLTGRYAWKEQQPNFTYKTKNIGIGARYYIMPYKMISPYLFGELNYAIQNWRVTQIRSGQIYFLSGSSSATEINSFAFDNDINSLFGIGGAGMLLNINKKFGCFTQVFYQNNGFLNHLGIEAGFNLKFIKIVN